MEPHPSQPLVTIRLGQVLHMRLFIGQLRDALRSPRACGDHFHCGRRNPSDTLHLLHGMEKLCTRHSPRLPSLQGHAQVERCCDVVGIWGNAGCFANHVWFLSILEAACAVFRNLQYSKAEPHNKRTWPTESP